MRTRAAIAVVLVLALSACGGTRRLQLTASSDVPAARGVVKVSTTGNGNTKLDLSVEHLAPPERVSPGAMVYMVWVRGADAGAQVRSLGALKVDRQLDGRITAVTPLRAFDLYITAEPSQQGVTPTGKTLLSTTVSMK